MVLALLFRRSVAKISLAALHFLHLQIVADTAMLLNSNNYLRTVCENTCESFVVKYKTL